MLFFRSRFFQRILSPSDFPPPHYQTPAPLDDSQLSSHDLAVGHASDSLGQKPGSHTRSAMGTESMRSREVEGERERSRGYMIWKNPKRGVAITSPV